MRSVISIRLGFFFILLVLLSSGCKDPASGDMGDAGDGGDGNDTTNVDTTTLSPWEIVEFPGSSIRGMELFQNRLYVPSDSTLYWIDPSTGSRDWDSAIIPGFKYITDVHRVIDDISHIWVSGYPKTGYSTGLYKSEDDGQTWFADTVGLTAIRANFPDSIYQAVPKELFGAGGMIYAIDYHELFSKSVSSNDWNLIYQIGTGGRLKSFTIAENRPNILWGDHYNGFGYSKIHNSVDAGVSWHWLGYESLDQFETTTNIVLTPTDDQAVMISTGESLFFSSNFGISWESASPVISQRDTTLQLSWIYKAVQNPRNSDEVYMLYRYKLDSGNERFYAISHSRDRGKTWRRENIPDSYVTLGGGMIVLDNSLWIASKRDQTINSILIYTPD